MTNGFSILALLLAICTLMSCNLQSSSELLIPEAINFPLAVGNQWVYENVQTWQNFSTDSVQWITEYDTLTIEDSVRIGADTWWRFTTRPRYWDLRWNYLMARHDSLFGMTAGFLLASERVGKVGDGGKIQSNPCDPPELEYIPIPPSGTIDFASACHHKTGYRVNAILDTPAGGFDHCLNYYITDPEEWVGTRYPETIKPGIGFVRFDYFIKDGRMPDTLISTSRLISVDLQLRSYLIH